MNLFKSLRFYPRSFRLSTARGHRTTTKIRAVLQSIKYIVEGQGLILTVFAEYDEKETQILTKNTCTFFSRKSTIYSQTPTIEIRSDPHTPLNLCTIR